MQNDVQNDRIFEILTVALLLDSCILGYVSTSLLVMCLKELDYLLAPMAIPSPLVASSILPSILLHLFKHHYNLKCIECLLFSKQNLMDFMHSM